MLVTILVFVLILVVLVIAHEAGHFFVARSFGMYVEEFAVGFPPRLWSWVKNGVRYSINAIPLGGYVKIPGENGDDETVLEKAKALLHGEKLFSKQLAWKRILVLCAGVGANILIGWILLVPVFMQGIEGGIVVVQVAQNSPAQQAEIQPGDQIMGFDSVDLFITKTKEQVGNEMTIVVKRGQDERTVVMNPRVNPPQGEGALGIALGESGIPAVSFFDAVKQSAQLGWSMIVGIFTLLIGIIGSVFGLASREGAQFITGPVGVFQATAQAASLGWVHVLYLMAIISINLAAVNIFPFPALDGGRVVLTIVEKIKGSPVSARTQGIINGVGFFVLMALLLVVSIRDVVKLW